MNVDTPGRQLLFSTVRITNVLTSGVATSGTGFLLFVDLEDGRHAPLLLTNKHVVANSARLITHFIQRGETADEPNLGVGFDVELDPGNWFGHPEPSVDVAVVPMAPVFASVGPKLFTRALPLSLLATEVEGLYLDAIEEITFVGYPDGRYDTKHLTPIVRRGVTATPLDLDLNGQPTFLVDGSVFGGSSGSPVFLFNEGAYRGPHGLHIGTRMVLVGIIAQTWVRPGVHPVEVAAQEHVKIAKELNLGVAFNARAIKETVDAVITAAGVRTKAPHAGTRVAIDPATDTLTPPTSEG
ncbi:trypsin-like peptidase domain-containing protein [Streptomyces qaidamensis]|uniref:trypsin-like peptidase domain-containing protein n=1 Tax=Streptomyces qaidamensis TaxID=1783515 RepID=UPI0036E63345